MGWEQGKSSVTQQGQQSLLESAFICFLHPLGTSDAMKWLVQLWESGLSTRTNSQFQKNRQLLCVQFGAAACGETWHWWGVWGWIITVINHIIGIIPEMDGVN